jgi:hypothetical protein
MKDNNGDTQKEPYFKQQQKKPIGWLEKTLRVSDMQHKAGEGKPTVAVADQNTPKELRDLS